MNPKIGMLFAFAFTVIGLGILSPLVFSDVKKYETLPRYEQAPSFSFTDQYGSSFSSDTLRGGVWVVNFFFTSCQGPCPITTTHLARVNKSIGPGAAVQFVSISVDPETDTEEKLLSFAERYDAGRGRWHFLRGEQAAVDELLNHGFKVGSMEDPKFHSNRVLLIDQGNYIRGYFSGTDPESIAELERGIRKLTGVRKSKGLS